ncbi:hypothetical protein PILCRDRAFT_810821 [Piloderma croceum F 1598]|uniref:Uncharacterized protein n=1 Tax=Piloderma croceum (strain F 1598) TaxID=765440 RepID=A0A0C3GIR8_PILCF|nr:hypothetical protein PILCRDRAFT_810821 [Piloderma croceum F 1598]
MIPVGLDRVSARLYHTRTPSIHEDRTWLRLHSNKDPGLPPSEQHIIFVPQKEAIC